MYEKTLRKWVNESKKDIPKELDISMHTIFSYLKGTNIPLNRAIDIQELSNNQVDAFELIKPEIRDKLKKKILRDIKIMGPDAFIKYLKKS